MVYEELALGVLLAALFPLDIFQPTFSPIGFFHAGFFPARFFQYFLLPAGPFPVFFFQTRKAIKPNQNTLKLIHI